MWYGFIMGGIIRQIFSDHWKSFVNSVGKEKVRPAIFQEVERMLSCGDFSNGYAEYHCTCGEKKRVAFTCKSRFCPSCGAVYTERWVESMSEKMFAIPHRHIVFTIPEELRIVFAKDRTLLKVLSDTAAHVIKWSLGKRRKKSKVYVAVIAVLHTFGRDLKWNPHVHVLVAEGYYVEESDCWKKLDYIHYEQLRKSWQFSLLKALRHVVPKRLVNKLYKDKSQGFYVHAKNKMRDARGAAKYIGRYVGRPAIAERRIISYDGKQVTFWYEKHDTKERVEITLTVYEFIGLLIRHIADKGFKMVRHYGLYARTKKAEVNTIKTLGEVYEELKVRRRSWRNRIKKSFGIDPLRCKKCGRIMYFYDIVWPKYGSLLDIMKRRMEKVYEKEEAQLKEYYESIQSWDALYMPSMSA
jgi:hypothetical protein